MQAKLATRSFSRLNTTRLQQCKPLGRSYSFAPLLSTCECESLWGLVSTLPVSHAMVPILCLTGIQAALGVFDNIYHHELTERLPWRKTAWKEQYIHAARGGLYGTVFASLAGVTPTGALAYGFAGILAIEAGLTLYDFVTEDRTRLLPWTERVTHTLLTLNYGAVLALWLPIILGDWAHRGTGLSFEYYGLPTYFNAFVVLGVAYWLYRDYVAAHRLLKTIEQDNLHCLKLNLTKPNQSILVTGATGFIGSALCNNLLREGHAVTCIVRSKAKAIRALTEKGKLTLVESIDTLAQSASKFDVVINLQGEPLVDKRWSGTSFIAREMRIINSIEARMKQITASRVDFTAKLSEYINSLPQKPSVVVNASAIGYYGLGKNNENYDESSNPIESGSFSHRLCAEWEAVASKMGGDNRTRVVYLRTGIVLGRDGGVAANMLFPFEFGVGGPFGDGKQWMSWIHLDDLQRMIAFAINNESVVGPLNGTAPNPVTNSEFAKSLGSSLSRPAFIPLFPFQLKLMFGSQLADELFLNGVKILPNVAEKNGFRFLYPRIADAWNEIVNVEKKSLE